MSIGERLKEAREERDLTLNDIRDNTKIRVKYLQALEDEEYDIIPGTVYVKVFIKGYAEEVGLDGSELVREYQEILDEKNRIEKEKQEEEEEKNDKAFFQNRLLNTIIIVVVLLVLAVVIYNVFLLNDSQNQNYNLQEPVNAVENEPVSTTYPAEDDSEIENTDSEIENNNTDSAAEESTAQINRKEKEIELIIKEKSWVQVEVDGEQVFQGILNEGVIRKFTGQERIDLKIGNAAGVLVKEDEETLGPWGEQGEVIERSF